MVDDSVWRTSYGRFSTDSLVGWAVTTVAIEAWGPDADEINFEGMAATMALGMVDRYADAAALSMTRIEHLTEQIEAVEANSEGWTSGGAEEWARMRDMSAIELHWYLSSWASVGRGIEVLAKRMGELRMRAAVRVRKRHLKTLDDYADLRNHVEHQEERFPGEKHAAYFVRPVDPSRPTGTIMIGWDSDGPGRLKIGETSCDVSPASVVTLRSIVAELHLEVREEAIDIMVAHTGSKGEWVERTGPPWGLDILQRRAERAAAPKKKRQR